MVSRKKISRIVKSSLVRHGINNVPDGVYSKNHDDHKNGKEYARGLKSQWGQTWDSSHFASRIKIQRSCRI